MKIVKKIGSLIAGISLFAMTISTHAFAKASEKTVEMTILFGGTAKSVGQLAAKGLENLEAQLYQYLELAVEEQ